jgi:DNA (cytosine-5)-methyltransferase 1
MIDLFSCQGGAAKGYHDAGFEVVGVDIEPQPRYPYEFIQADAIEVLRTGRAGDLLVADFDAGHASPPCQDHSETAVLGRGHGTGWMLAATLDLFPRYAFPWVVENVAGSSLPSQGDLFGFHGLTLCGCMFPELRGLLYEDRVFETSFGIPQPPHVRHQWPQTKMGRTPKPGECMQLTGHFTDPEEGRRRMRAGWMNRDGLAQAIPPAYTRFIGGRILERLAEQREAA